MQQLDSRRAWFACVRMRVGWGLNYWRAGCHTASTKTQWPQGSSDDRRSKAGLMSSSSRCAPTNMCQLCLSNIMTATSTAGLPVPNQAAPTLTHQAHNANMCHLMPAARPIKPKDIRCHCTWSGTHCALLRPVHALELSRAIMSRSQL
jgi:hypothetical protein